MDDERCATKVFNANLDFFEMSWLTTNGNFALHFIIYTCFFNVKWFFNYLQTKWLDFLLSLKLWGKLICHRDFSCSFSTPPPPAPPALQTCAHRIYSSKVEKHSVRWFLSSLPALNSVQFMSGEYIKMKPIGRLIY